MAESSDLSLLLVEDNPGDAHLLQEALAEGAIRPAVHVASDGQEALDHLRRCSAGEEPMPDLVLLDLNLPRVDGRQALACIKRDPALSWLPVIVLTSSDAEQDIHTAYAEHANCYLRKPLGLDEYFELVHCIEEFWLCLVRLPRPVFVSPNPSS